MTKKIVRTNQLVAAIQIQISSNNAEIRRCVFDRFTERYDRWIDTMTAYSIQQAVAICTLECAAKNLSGTELQKQFQRDVALLGGNRPKRLL